MGTKEGAREENMLNAMSSGGAKLFNAGKEIGRLEYQNDKLRSALKRCADKLERCAIVSGTAPEYAAEAVKEFRDLLSEKE